ncbi:hypothetical protein [Bradyrhizobium betae]|uniref:Uncharacterized protein n=1 Tax=Bradyrhizobium betae TaxID=244734 RepID=A0A4Q1V1M9_9BRAD|nr:hypothetical protein [Bradyrhizobium betae]RXT44982.1 hypothetical protein B5V03_20680 [Bradyrhizobium betae]
MRTHATTSGLELLLGVIATRLAVLVVVGWSLTLLPQKARNSELACVPAAAERIETRTTPKSSLHAGDPAFDDMLRHD